jgi:hypothetical protein
VKTALGFLGEPGPKWLSSLPHSQVPVPSAHAAVRGSRSLARLAPLAL